MHDNICSNEESKSGKNRKIKGKNYPSLLTMHKVRTFPVINITVGYFEDNAMVLYLLLKTANANHLCLCFFSLQVVIFNVISNCCCNEFKFMIQQHTVSMLLGKNSHCKDGRWM